MKHFVEDDTWRQNQASALLAAFAALALGLSAIGLYGVISFAVSRRTHEIGIRVAIGAPRLIVAGLVLVENLRPVGVGIFLGMAGALALTRFLTSLLFGVARADAGVLAAVVAVIAVAAAAACWMPVRRALRVDPIAALRCE